HGPPGTGKTRTLAEFVAKAVARGERVLACAASNAAVDNLAERLVERGLVVVRLGHPARVSPAVEAHGLDAQVAASDDYALARGWIAEAHALRLTLDKRWRRRAISYAERRAGFAEVRRLLRDARAHLAGLKDAIVARAQVVCATAAGADSDLLAEAEFDWVALDEATQAVDPIALVALLRAPRAVLAGDPCQLPPTVIDPRAAAAGLGRSFFERLAEAAPCASRLLTVEYRMPRELLGFPSAQHYGGRLEADPSVAERRLSDLGVLPDPLRPEPWCFLDTAGKGWDETRLGDDPSLCNPEQAARVAAEVERLLARGLPASEVGVICAYSAQVRLLRERLARWVSEGLEISSVDGFQGREKEAVVVDLVRSNPEARVGFLQDTRRTNVALTRARRFLLVVGDSATLAPHPYYAALLAAADAAGAYLSAWADDAPPFADAEG
ncbi:MAG: AAA family ATPase, partial [Planctomycetes bacterium]|nr:AAA family ATPase [Planctomycetota bacterium]